jgi:hypothetical protein
MSTSAPKWRITGEYFETCSCTVVCPCLFSTAPQLTSRPTEGHCAVLFAVHIENGRFADQVLDGLNVALIAFTPGPMADGNWKIAAYVDERANAQQEAALGAILGGAAGGPIGALAPLISEMLGTKRVPITYQVTGKRRSVEIPGIMHMAVNPLPTGHPSGEMWAQTGHPFNPDRLAMASGEPGSTFADHGMRWDNSGRNGHYAPIEWAN